MIRTILEEFIDYIVYPTILIVCQQFYGCLYFVSGTRLVDNITSFSGTYDVLDEVYNQRIGGHENFQ